MRRFDTPLAPLGWTGQGAELLRIVDPLGDAIAWLAPTFGGACVGYAIRAGGDQGAPWHHLLRANGPRALRATPRDYGGIVLGPTLDDPDAARQARWRFIERDPTAATCAARCDTVRLTLTARLEDSALHLDLLATNEGPAALPLALGLRLCFADDFRLDSALGDTPRLHSTDAAMRLALLAAEGAAPSWQSTAIAEGGIAIEARATTAPGVTVAPGATLALGIVVGREL